MADSGESELSRSRQRKVMQKQKKAENILKKHEGISPSKSPTKHLLVANGGLGNGVKREDLLKIFKEYGEVSGVSMTKAKPYAFVTYANTGSALSAFEKVHGRSFSDLASHAAVTLYLSFISEVPDHPSERGCYPPGLSLIKEFVDEGTEQQLLDGIRWNTEVEKGLKHRRVKHFGYEFRYDTNNVDKGAPLLDQPIPDQCLPVIQRIMETGLVGHRPDQITVNQYQPGQGIPPHTDTHSAFEDAIISLSLGAQVVMDFKHPSGKVIPILLPRRSLLILAGEARYLWTHGITPRKNDVIYADDANASTELTLIKRETRTSFTFRAIRHTPCDCSFPQSCDSQAVSTKGGDSVAADDDPSLPQSPAEAARLESQHVHDVYEEIADHFSHTRYRPWPRVIQFLQQLEPGSLLLDIGCGNGKYFGINSSLYEVGCDRSFNLADISKERGFEVFVCNALSLPIRCGTFDACICIAVVHHFSTKERRLACLREIARVLAKGGKGLVYVWAMEQERKKTRSKYLRPPPTDADSRASEISGRTDIETTLEGPSTPSAKLPLHVNRTNFKSQDMLVPWNLRGQKPVDQANQSGRNSAAGVDGKEVEGAPTLGGLTQQVYHRYYHVFQEGEIEELCAEVGGVQLAESFYDQGNWCMVITKNH